MTKAAELANMGEILTNGQIGGRRNVLINGTGIINQRGSNTTINTYGPDRWRSYGGPGSFTFSSGATAGAGEGDTFAIKFQRPEGNSVTNAMGIAQGLESRDSKQLAGKTLTFSFRVRVGADWNVNVNFNVYGGTGTDENPVGMTNLASQFSGSILSGNLTTSWQTITATGTIASDRTQVSVAIAWTPSGTAGANEYIEFREFQLEVGSKATPFEHRSFGEELMLCKRYCNVIAPIADEAFSFGHVRTTTVAVGTVRLHPVMRGTPTLAFSGVTEFQVQHANTATQTTGMAAGELSTEGVTMIATVGSGLTVGQGVEIREHTSGASVTIDAEL